MKTVFCIYLFTMLFALGYSQTYILSGSTGGSYYQIANDIKKIAKDSIIIVSTKGSFENYEKIDDYKSNGLEIAILQYDVLFAMTNHTDSASRKNIQILLPLGQEEIHLITRKGSGIKSLDDLKNKRVGIGTTEQGTQVTAAFIKRYSNIIWNDIDISFSESVPALFDRYIDAFFFVGSAPVSKLIDVPQQYKDSLELVPLTNSKLEQIYSKVTIKAGVYPWQTQDISTLALGFGLFTDVQKESASDLAKYTSILTTIKNSITRLQIVGHPTWRDVNFKFTSPFPIHPIAKQVFNIN